MKNLVEIRCDDVLQTSLLTKDQIKRTQNKTLFEWFKEIDKVFEEYNYPMTLAILEEGIDKNPEWTEYIKKNQHRYKIEMHGREHIRYGELNKEDLFDDLFWAKKRIECEFQTKISTWYVPFGRKGRNKYAGEICRALGIKVGIPEEKVDETRWLCLYEKTGKIPFNHINFHFWHESQNNKIKQILEICNK